MPNDIPGFPTVTIGGVTLFDIAPVVSADRYARYKTSALVIHHSVTGVTYDSMAAEVYHIRAIDAYHASLGYGGFGYNGVVFPSGRVYVVGGGGGARAHVAGLNGELEGLCMIGTYTAVDPGPGITLGGGRWVLAKMRQHGLLAVNPHRLYNPFIPPYYRTECPGAHGVPAIETMLRVAVALARDIPV